MLEDRALLTWLESQEGSYNYYNPGECLVARYLQQALGKEVSVSPFGYYWLVGDLSAGKQPYPEHWNDIAKGVDYDEAGRTFALAAQRLREHMA